MKLSTRYEQFCFWQKMDKIVCFFEFSNGLKMVGKTRKKRGAAAKLQRMAVAFAMWRGVEPV